MISRLCAFCKRIFVESLPPSLAHNTPNMRFSTTEKTWLANEARYLFFTENGPVEIAFRPYKALKITGGLAGLILMLIIAGPVLYKHLPEMMPERDMATDIAANITTDIAKSHYSPGEPAGYRWRQPTFFRHNQYLKRSGLTCVNTKPYTAR